MNEIFRNPSVNLDFPSYRSVIYPTRSCVVPDMTETFRAVDSINEAIRATPNFMEIYPEYLPIGLTAYAGQLSLITIVNSMLKNGPFGDPGLKTSFDSLTSRYPPETLAVPQPLIPYLTALGNTQSPTFSNTDNSEPLDLYRNLGFTLGNTYVTPTRNYFRTKGFGAFIPLPLLALDQIGQHVYQRGNPDPATACTSWFGTIFGEEASLQGNMRFHMYNPMARGDVSLSPYAYDNFLSNGLESVKPNIIRPRHLWPENRGDIHMTLEHLCGTRFPSRCSPISLDFMDYTVRIGNRVSKLFQRSIPLSEIFKITTSDILVERQILDHLVERYFPPIELIAPPPPPEGKKGPETPAQRSRSDLIARMRTFMRNEPDGAEYSSSDEETEPKKMDTGEPSKGKKRPRKDGESAIPSDLISRGTYYEELPDERIERRFARRLGDPNARIRNGILRPGPPQGRPDDAPPPGDEPDPTGDIVPNDPRAFPFLNDTRYRPVGFYDPATYFLSRDPNITDSVMSAGILTCTHTWYTNIPAYLAGRIPLRTDIQIGDFWRNRVEYRSHVNYRLTRYQQEVTRGLNVVTPKL